MTLPRCACGEEAKLVADLSGHGMYLREPICSTDCPLVRASGTKVDVVADEKVIRAAIEHGQCWCGMNRHVGTLVTWCPKHGQIDVVEDPCN